MQVVFFGANDSVLPDCHQYVPLERFKANLESLVTHDALREHNPKVILVTPPPVCEYKMARFQDVTAFPRKAHNTRLYAQAAIEVGEQLGMPVVNLWKLCLEYAGWRETDTLGLAGSTDAPQNDLLGELLYDGKLTLSHVSERNSQ
jgi:hypothetical protein